MKNHEPTNSTPVLSCHDLTVGYKATPVIRNINLEFSAGHFIALLGPNGAGKTTLLRTLTRHLEPVTGTITVGGRSLNDFTQAELARIMAVVLTDRVTPPLFSVFQFVALGRYPHTDFLGRLTDYDKRVIEQSLAAVRADDLTRRDFASLSDGERQKVLVARALAQEPKILLLDEPTAHLDLKHRVEVMAILRNLCRSKYITVIASLHDVDIAAKVSDRVALVKEGVITAWGYPEEVLTSKTVAELYDFDSACFSHHLGSIEIRGQDGGQRVFVVGGMGLGAAVFRMLAKKGYCVSTGILLSNDLDYFVAQSLELDCVSLPPGRELQAELLTATTRKMAECDLVIDAGATGNGVYPWNNTLLNDALAMGKPLFRLAAGERGDTPDSTHAGVIHVANTGELFELMETVR